MDVRPRRWPALGKRHRRVSVDDALARFPTFDRGRLASAFLFYDAHADDARLTLTIVRTAVAHGAIALNYAEVVAFDGTASRVVGARDRSRTTRSRGPRAPGRQRDRRLGRRGASPRRRRAPRVDSSGERRTHHRAVGARAQRGRRDRPVGTRRPLRLRDPLGGTHLHRDDGYRLRRSSRRPAVHHDDALPARRAERRHHIGAQPADIVGSWAGLRPLLAARATLAPPTCHGATQCGWGRAGWSP